MKLHINATLQYGIHDERQRAISRLGAGVDGRVMTFLRAAHEVVVVVTPDSASIADAYRVY